MRYGAEEAHVKGVKNASDADIKAFGEKVVEAKYGNLFQMYEKITASNPYKEPMMIYPAVHYTMGGLWVDYNLMTTVQDVLRLVKLIFGSRSKPLRCFCAYAGFSRWLFCGAVYRWRVFK